MTYQPPDDPSIVDAELDEARPEPDRVAMERVRARAELALFGYAEPARLGRYRLLDPIAGGGMGVVYGAYDPELDRRVALKVIHPRRSQDDRAHRRLIVEARALAKLDHPNVVKVHDVLIAEGQVVIVMELVEGQTLASWETAPHTWQEAIAVYTQAAEGLAAAHSVDVIHRDFKPSNAIIGADGRVRVLDFGLARLTQHDDDGRPPDAGAPIPTDLTQTGDVIGTLGYSSPEQLRGQTVTAASDQFSLCVSLHHAVEGVAPFTGDTLPARLASIETGTVALASTDRHVPAWLRAVIARGLSPEPERRFPAMTDLLAELRRSRGWRRWRAPTLIATITALSVSITAGVRGRSAADECDGGKAQIASVWNPGTRDHLLQILDSIGSPYAREVRDRVASDLDRYALDWTDTHRTTCTDHRHGTTSAALLDRRMTCLSERLGDLQAAVGVLARTDLDSLAHVMDVVARIPGVSRCSDFGRLQAEVEPPDSPDKRNAVSVARARISTAEALSRAGRSVDARTAAVEAEDRARATGYGPVQVEAALAESRILLSQRDLSAAAVPLSLARTEALKLRMLSPAVEASARLIYVEGMRSASISNLERDIAYVVPLSAAHECDHFARPLLLNNIGTVYLAEGHRDDALRYFTEAKSALGSYAPADLELSVIDRNLAMLTPNAEQRMALAEAAWHRLRDALGPEHPSTLEALVAYAEYVPDPATAYQLMSTATEAYHKFHPTILRQVAVADAARAFLAGELEDRARTVADYTIAIATTRNSADPDVVILHHLSTGELALAQEDPARAIAELTPVRDQRLASARWFERADGLRAAVGLGLAEAARGRDEEAIRHLEAAVTGYPQIMAMNEEVKFRRSYARAESALAAILVRSGKDLPRATALVRDAVAFYQAAGPEAYRRLLESARISAPSR